MIKCLFTLGITFTVLNGAALAGNYDIYGSLRAQEQYIDEAQQAWEQQHYEYEQACRLDEINQRLQEQADRLQELQDSIDNQRLQEASGN